ncbi:aminotransferase class I/II-fold pyridoxal phosphate-dependent enzyme [Rhizobium lusitanum]|uniref:Aminotransferase class I/II-fold pyridoxal phosphate-dependent enzyme n=1 Tax=Rhizobium lusitanum TaxID=293958 RepID=A0A6L9UC75_9HYPH|nr:PLP-dependent aminotransferase family protein [Rhizobium lusitanum]NEI73595.1 aminotransferase class I/II-fold pyridoxal phosphate-dependent enzyme [Rhizobium lusitanum]
MDMELVSTQLQAKDIAVLFQGKDSTHIATQFRELIETGSIAEGSKMPSVREMASNLGVSVGTIALAWSDLKNEGLITTRRRGGTYVVGLKQAQEVGRTSWPPAPLNLSQASPDPRLQPSLEKALIAGLNADKMNSVSLDYIIEPLRLTVQSQWPFEAEAWTIVGASSESMLLCLQAATSPGDKIAVEQPTSSRLLAIARLLNLQIVGVECDQSGPMIEPLSSALGDSPKAFIYQPRGHQPLGITVSVARVAEMAAILRKHQDVCVIEDDALGPLCADESASLGSMLPQQTLLIRSYCKAFGLDLRSSVIGGASEWVDRVRLERSRGLGVTSRILQGALNYLLRDPETETMVSVARKNYAFRRRTLSTVLDRLGVEISPARDGLMVWISVEDEAAAISHLSSKAIQAAPGRRFFGIQVKGHHIAISVGQLPTDRVGIEAVASEIAIAARIGTDDISFD